MNGEDDQVLSSWKEIAAYFGKGVRTVQRWERQLALPIRRPKGIDAQIVFARKSELAAWMATRPGFEANPPNGNGQGKHDETPVRSKPPLGTTKGRHLEHMVRMRSLVGSMRKETERLQATTNRILENWSRAEEMRSQKTTRP